MPFTNLPYLNQQTTGYTLLMSDEVVEFNITTGQTATLPTAANVTGKRFTIKNLDTSTSLIILTINTTSSQTIDGRASGSIKLSPGDFIQVISDGINWKVIVMQETIAARLTMNTSSAAVAIGALTVVPFDTKTYDTHGAVINLGSNTVRFVAPANGRYGFKSGITTASAAWTSGNAIDMYAYKNGAGVTLTQTQAWSTSTGVLSGVIADSVYLAAGEFIDIRWDHNRTGGTTAIQGAADGRCWAAFEKVGN